MLDTAKNHIEGKIGIDEAERRIQSYYEDRGECHEMEEETKERCDQMVAEAELKSQQCWDNCSAKIRQLAESYEGLKYAIGTLFPEATQEKPRIVGQHF